MFFNKSMIGSVFAAVLVVLFSYSAGAVESSSNHVHTARLMMNSIATASVNRIADRMDNLRSVSGLSGGAGFEETGAWGKLLYTHANLQGVDGFKSDVAGFVVGADREFQQLTVGTAFSFTHTNGKTNGKNADTDTYMAFLYALYERSERVYLKGSIGFGFSRFDIDESDRFNGDLWTTIAYAGYRLTNDYVVEGGLRYVMAGQNDYYQNGRFIEADSAETVTTVAALRYKKDMGSFSPKASIGVLYDIGSDTASFSMIEAGTVSYINGKRLPRFGAEGGIGIAYRTQSAWTIDFDYNFQLRRNYNDQTLSVKAVYEF